ncbi:hypothetical protein PVAP13_5KG242407 [Panicum virgatum]|uniref:Uncharacterized protein n=1 Tax=Panicum virgatum TaxID=38727 RepID=A0A8T0SHX7_PANVG|nr:hypothetical protein PVAP13_5KG242407 [Panicum virgatum]
MDPRLQRTPSAHRPRVRPPPASRVRFPRPALWLPPKKNPPRPQTRNPARRPPPPPPPPCDGLRHRFRVRRPPPPLASRSGRRFPSPPFAGRAGIQPPLAAPLRTRPPVPQIWRSSLPAAGDSERWRSDWRTRPSRSVSRGSAPSHAFSSSPARLPPRASSFSASQGASSSFSDRFVDGTGALANVATIHCSPSVRRPLLPSCSARQLETLRKSGEKPLSGRRHARALQRVRVYSFC